MKDKIINLLESNRMSVRNIAKALDAHETKAFKQLVKQIAELEADGTIIFDENGICQLSHDTQPIVEGIYRANEKGFGFVMVDNRVQDIYIPVHLTNNAMPNDVVEVQISKEAKGDKNAEGQIVRVVKRALSQVVGEFTKYPDKAIKETGYIGYMIPVDKTLRHLTCFITSDGLTSVSGTICVAHITNYPDQKENKPFEGVLVKEIGHKDEPGVDILAILQKHGIPTEFPTRVTDEANNIPEQILESEVTDRVDLRDKWIITIDGADAKDLDDAISLEITPDGLYELSVHIADVSHYVTENSALDDEAYNRGTSVYLVDRVVPMLPQRLSNGICSLHPAVDRLTMTCTMTINASGLVQDYSIYPSVIQSKQRMTYDKVNEAIVEGNRNAQIEYENSLELLENLRQLHYALYHQRRRRGAIEFETKEIKVLVDESGAPIGFEERQRGLAERMIESFMLVANETVAKHIMDLDYPFLYRVHEQPKTDKIQQFMLFASRFGVKMKAPKETIQPKALQKVLDHVSDKPYENMISTVLLRSMQQARYDSTPLGHFGLASEFYTHFTSPIRRYPDLIVHRYLKWYAKNQFNKTEKDNFVDKLEDIADQSSRCERRAVEAERDTLALKKAEYMMDKIGEQFEGIISSITRFGMFVELDFGIEGLVHVSKMTDDHYVFLENQLMLVGERTRHSYELGQRVKVKVIDVSIETYAIDFTLVNQKSKKQIKKIPSAIKKKRTKKRRRKR